MKSLNEYQQQAMSTAIFPVDRSLDYTVLGLGSEVGEMAEAWLDNKKTLHDVASECGDAYWYAAAIASTLDYTLEAVMASYRGPVIEARLTSNLILDLTATSGNLEGLVKKAIRDDDGHFTQEREEKAVQLLGRIILILDQLAVQLGSSRYALMNDNLDKLADRKKRGVLKGSRGPPLTTTQLSKHYTEADRETWKSLLEEGMPYRRVAEVVGVHRDTIRKYLPGMGMSKEEARKLGTFMKHHNEKMRKSVYG